MIPSTLIFTQFEGGEMIRLEITELTHLVLSIGITNTFQIGFFPMFIKTGKDFPYFQKAKPNLYCIRNMCN